MIAVDLRNANKGETLRLPDDPKRKTRRYLIDSVVHSHGGYVTVYVKDASSRITPMPIANGALVEVTP